MGQIGYRLNSTSPKVLFARLLTFFKSDSPNPDSALYILRTANSMYPNNFFVNWFIGAFYVRIGMDEEARRFLNRSIELDPLNLGPRRWLAIHQILTGDFAGAESGCKKMIQLDSTPGFGHRFLAEVYILKGKLENASQELRKAEQLEGNKTSDVQAMLLAAEGKREEALKLGRNIMILSLLKMKKETLEKIDSLALSPATENFMATLACLDKNPLWDFIRDEPEFKRIRERAKKDHNEKVKRYGRLD